MSDGIFESLLLTKYSKKFIYLDDLEKIRIPTVTLLLSHTL